MPQLKFFYPWKPMSKKRPRTDFRSGIIHHSTDYLNWLERVKLQTTEQAINQGLTKPIRADLVYSEFHLSNLGNDPDNVEGALWDAMQKPLKKIGDNSKVFVSDTFKSIPIHTTVGKAVTPGKECFCLWVVYQGDEVEWEQFLEREKQAKLRLLRSIR
jgi:Holliday junction resolvase RusA-like endonuclease